MSVTLVEFYADWCGPCKQQEPIVDEVDEERDDVEVVKVDVDEEQELANKFQVRSIPMIMLLEPGTTLEEPSVAAVFTGVTQKTDLVESVEAAQ